MAQRVTAQDVPSNLYRQDSPLAATVLDNVRLTHPDSPNDVRHIVLDTSDGELPFREGQSVGVIPPGTDERGKPHKLRLYSIASSRAGEDGQGRRLALCVKRVVAHTENGVFLGVASNYLCDLKPGDRVHLTGPVGKAFLLPDDPEAHVVALATGTGIAPFRGFWRHLFLENPGFRGRMTLFFGVQTHRDLLYADEIEDVARRFPRFAAYFALSREQQTPDGRRMYVQHRLAEHPEVLAAFFESERVYVYICGLKGMEDGIEEVFRNFATRELGLGDWEERLRAWKRARRWCVETY